jgi:hypothetical protein
LITKADDPRAAADEVLDQTERLRAKAIARFTGANWGKIKARLDEINNAERIALEQLVRQFGLTVETAVLEFSSARTSTVATGGAGSTHRHESDVASDVIPDERDSPRQAGNNVEPDSSSGEATGLTGGASQTREPAPESDPAHEIGETAQGAVAAAEGYPAQSRLVEGDDTIVRGPGEGAAAVVESDHGDPAEPQEIERADETPAVAGGPAAETDSNPDVTAKPVTEGGGQLPTSADHAARAARLGMPQPKAKPARNMALTPEMEAAKASALVLGQKMLADFRLLQSRLAALKNGNVPLEVRLASIEAPVIQGRKVPARRVFESKVDLAHNAILMDGRELATKYASEIGAWLNSYLDPKGERGKRDVWDEEAHNDRIKAQQGPFTSYVESLRGELDSVNRQVLERLETANLLARRANQLAVQSLKVVDVREEDATGDDDAEE